MLLLEVEQSTAGRLVGRFSYELEQRSGERNIDGQSMQVVLAVPVRAVGSFDLPILAVDSESDT
jgi:hypothetical protein